MFLHSITKNKWLRASVWDVNQIKLISISLLLKSKVRCTFLYIRYSLLWGKLVNKTTSFFDWICALLMATFLFYDSQNHWKTIIVFLLEYYRGWGCNYFHRHTFFLALLPNHPPKSILVLPDWPTSKYSNMSR